MTRETVPLLLTLLIAAAVFDGSRYGAAAPDNNAAGVTAPRASDADALLRRLEAEVAAKEPSPDRIARLRADLAKIGKPARPPVVALFRNRSRPPLLRAEAARIMIAIEGKRSLFAIVEVLSEELARVPSPLGARLIETLGDLGDSRPLPAFTRALRHPDPSVRFAAAVAMGKVGDRSSAAPLRKALDDPDAAVRSAAKRALARFPTEG